MEVPDVLLREASIGLNSLCLPVEAGRDKRAVRGKG